MSRPTLLFDGDCGFCRFWVERWRKATGERVEYAPYQAAAARFPQLPPQAFAEAVQLVEEDRATRGAEAAFRALSYSPRRIWGVWLSLYRALPPFAWASECVYRFIARRRPLFSRLTQLLWGPSPTPYAIGGARRALLIGLGLCYLAAFLSLGAQIRGLVGPQGILPAPGFSDGLLVGLCAAGALSALSLTLGFACGPAALACWALYLILCAAGGEFLAFQWDSLLLEAGLIAVFLAPWSWRAKTASRPSKTAFLLMRLLLAKLVLQSGLVKLLSGDPNWRSLESLRYHYWTQPLPTPLAWWANRLPLAAQKASCLAALCIELGAPPLLLGPRRVRFLGAALIASLMAAITLTGNYGFFTFLTAALCASALDDGVPGLPRLAPRPAAPPAPARAWLVGAFAALWISLSAIGFASGTLGKAVPGVGLFEAAAPLRSINDYGLFAVMTTRRDEIAIEVSADGRDWREWPFRWKPGDPRRAPPFLPFYMPRLDWQMWFAALGPAQASPWLANLVYRLLQGSPDVLALMGPSPLGARRPRFLRAALDSYSFAEPEAGPVGPWWRRERLGLYFPAVSLSAEGSHR